MLGFFRLPSFPFPLYTPHGAHHGPPYYRDAAAPERVTALWRRNPNHHRVILALSTAFWDAYLRGDAEVLAWLNGFGPRSVMESDD